MPAVWPTWARCLDRSRDHDLSFLEMIVLRFEYAGRFCLVGYNQLPLVSVRGGCFLKKGALVSEPG